MSRMNHRRWLSHHSRPTSTPSHTRRPRSEPHEDRRMLALLSVNSDSDNTTQDRVLTLLEATLLVNNADDANAALGCNLAPGEVDKHLYLSLGETR